MWYVYILESDKNQNWHYVGSTDNLENRFEQHQAGEVQSTKPYRSLALEAYIAVKTEEKARRLEKYIKHGSGKTILKKRILQLSPEIHDEITY